MTKEAGDLYAKVMVDTPGLGLLDYAVPADMLVAVGDRVVVGLRTRNVVGIVAGLRAAADFAENRVRQIKAVLRDSAPMTEEWLALTRFAAGYYIRSWGEAAVPTLPVFFRRSPQARQGRSPRSTTNRVRRWRPSRRLPATAPSFCSA